MSYVWKCTLVFVLSGISMIRSDMRELDRRSLFTRFIENEQKHFRILANQPDSSKLFTGVQYAALQEYYKTVDPDELRVPFERMRFALEETRRKKALSALNDTESFKMDWIELDADMGGRCRTVMWDPNDEETKKVWAAGVSGGLWYREDIFNDNSRWKSVSDFWPGLAVSCLRYDPVNPSVYYAGTGEGQTARIIYRESSGRGFGIMKSENAGQTWSLIPSTEDFAYITDIEVRNENGKGVIYAGVVSGTYKGKDFEPEPGDGLYRSEDGGENWTQVLPVVPGTDHSYAPSDIEVTSDGRIFVGTGISLDGTGAGCILQSDDGFNWQVFSGYRDTILNSPFYNYPGRVILMSAPSDGNIVYAFLTAAGGELYSFKSPRGVFLIRSEDGGLTWEQIKTPPPDGTGGWAYIGWHALSSAINPTNPDKLYAGGLDLFTSNNAADNWIHISSWSNFSNSNPEIPNYVHADQHTIRFRPGSDSDALFTTDGGLFLSTNANLATPTFTEKNQGFNTLQHYTCAIHPQAGRHHFIAGAQDNGSIFYGKPDLPVAVRHNVSYGDGAFCFIDNDNPDLQISSSQFNYIYSTNEGLRFGFMENEIYNFQTGIFINPMDYDSRLDILFSNSCNFYGFLADTLMRMFNFKAKVSATLHPLYTGTTVPFSCIKVSPYSDGTTTLFLGTQDGRVFKVENADYFFGNANGMKSTEIGSVEFPASNVACIDIGENPDQILVIFSNYGVQSVWETRDGGKSWKDKDIGIPDMPVRWAIYHPANANQVLLATETGIWSTLNIESENVEWQPVSNFPNVRVDMIRIRESDYALVAATHGRGLWFSPQYPYLEKDGISKKTDLRIYPNPASTTTMISTGELQKESLDLRIYERDGKLVFEQTSFIPEGVFSAELNIREFSIGLYFVELRGEKEKYSSTMIINR